MLINATACHIDEEEARRLAMKTRRGLFDVIYDFLSRRPKVPDILRISKFYYPFYCAGAVLRFKRAVKLPTKDVAAMAVMECRYGHVMTMQGTPQLAKQEVPAQIVVKKHFTEDQARQKISEYLKKAGQRRYKVFPDVEIFELGLIYKPHYAVLCKRGGKEFYRVVDAEIRERNYRLEYIYKNLNFAKNNSDIDEIES